MTAKRRRLKLDVRWLKAWFDLTADEKKFVAGILAIALIGLTARYVHLKSLRPEPYQPEGIQQAAQGETP